MNIHQILRLIAFIMFCVAGVMWIRDLYTEAALLAFGLAFYMLAGLVTS